jgi:hypothetical protein
MGNRKESHLWQIGDFSDTLTFGKLPTDAYPYLIRSLGLLQTIKDCRD